MAVRVAACTSPNFVATCLALLNRISTSTKIMPGVGRPIQMHWSQVVLDFVTMFLEYLVTELERVAHPVLDAIVQKVSVLSQPPVAVCMR